MTHSLHIPAGKREKNTVIPFWQPSRDRVSYYDVSNLRIESQRRLKS
jgi:hypothetical protein